MPNATEARIEAVQSVVSHQARSVEYPRNQDNNKPLPLCDIFGQLVFGIKQMQQCLPKPLFAEFVKQIGGGRTMTRPVADAIAHAARIWAQERGATHFTHWFQPQTNATAEKHDSFLSLNYKATAQGLEVSAIDSFSGSQLLQSEPDASSFPNGGIRATFEARGYTIWDTSSPMFLQEGPHGTTVLYIPSVFISYNGQALDEKTIMLKSTEILSSATVELLHLLGHNDVKRVFTTLGTEQEFFLIDRGLYSLRPDLKVAGRTLLGSIPPKHQQLEDHYFGRIPSRVLAAISEAELELWKLGVPVKTRHNEVAPAQFEMAPVFEEATVAVDHNLLTMEVLHRVSHRHKLKVLFHEKPFKGVNGSGKHCNWSMSTDTGLNLLEPTDHPESNTTFLVVLVAVLTAVHRHQGLLRAAISSSSNEHRLGANEAPPGIISAFLGAQLTEVLNSIEENRPFKPQATNEIKTLKLGGTVLDLKVAALPEIARDLTDRNRTSPFAFTGNKFEFRAVGAKQSPSFPVVMLNAAVAQSIKDVTKALLQKKGDKPSLSKDDIMAVVKEFSINSRAIRFEGNNYSEEWVKEAEKRGLLNIRSAPDALKQILEQRNQEMLVSQGIFSKEEINSRYHVLVEKYAKDLLIEANTLKYMVQTNVLPAIFKYRKELAESVQALQAIHEETPEKKVIQILSKAVNDIQGGLEELDGTIEKLNSSHDINNVGFVANSLVPIFEKIRNFVDRVEEHVADGLWPYPKYIDLLFAA